jgi:SAM-dependent methyltransferase
LSLSADQLRCANAEHPHAFPIVNGVPILINEANSVFSVDDFLEDKATTIKPASRFIQFALDHLPTISLSLKSAGNYHRFAEQLVQKTPTPKVLIIGGGIAGQGMQDLLAQSPIEFFETDVYFGPRTAYICDAHDLPFADQSFDGVISQAVLEHVADPHRCVTQIHRVLKPTGLVYAETPFMQQVHLGAYDFTRFTHLGHRRLFRMFEEIESGAVCGPGMALAWAYEYFLLSFAQIPTLRMLIRGFVRLSAFWLKYFDYYLIDKPGALDAASGFYFLGQKSEQPLSDRTLIKLYRGGLA